MTRTRLHPLVRRNTESYLSIADRIFGRRLVGLYIVGSVALGGFRPDRSDLDLVAVLDEPRDGDCGRIRSVQLRSGARTAPPSLLRGRIVGMATCNTVYVSSSDLRRPVTRISPIGSHVGFSTDCGSAFDVNPVQWKTFADAGVALRGPEPSGLGLDPEPARLRQWNLDNLDEYWKPLAERLSSGRPSRHSRPYGARWQTAWTVLGTTRLHYTVATGEIATKEQAGEYALETFDADWHAIIRDALGYWRGERAAEPALADKEHRRRTTGAFGLHVIGSANALARGT